MKLQLYIKSCSCSIVVMEVGLYTQHWRMEGSKDRLQLECWVYSDSLLWLRWLWNTEWNHHMRNAPFLVDQDPNFECYLWESSVWAEGHVVLKGNLPTGCVALQWNSQFRGSTWISLSKALLQFLGTHCFPPITMETDEVLSPTAQHSPELFKFTESHCDRYIFVQHRNSKVTSLQLETFVSSCNARLR